MPDFSKLHAAQTKPRKSVEPIVTKTKAFNFNVDKRGEEHRREFQEKLQKEEEELRNMRKFKAQPLPDYEKLKIDIMPSDKPLTQSLRPVFHADFLPAPARKSVEPTKKDDPYPDFKF